MCIMNLEPRSKQALDCDDTPWLESMDPQSPTTFPTTLADLNFHDPNTSSSLYQSMRAIRRSTLSTPNRLRSIVADAEFVESTSETCSLPLIANERCGSWYINPANKAGSAYFKSTDGHHGQWSFSLRRLNIQVLSIVGQHGGAILVDSTRRGKNMPDAFLKTVPIWVAVMNRTLFPDKTDLHPLQCPPAPDDLGQSEVSQIEGRLDGFVTSLKELQLDFEELRRFASKPIKIQWAVNSYDAADQPELGWRLKSAKDQDCNQFILCSASRRVVGSEVSEAGYIQGAGDDSESWAHGLTPQLFWQHRELLLNETAEEDLPETIARLIADNAALPSKKNPRRINPTSTLYIGSIFAENRDKFDVVVDCGAPIEERSKFFLALGCREGKLGSRDLRHRLPTVREFVKAALVKDRPIQILATCSTCKDLSAGIALMLLCLFYNEVGDLEISIDPESINKAFIKKRLAWISSSLPDVNPSRATLQSVNAFLMERP